jgi:hypothetical protein
MRYSNIIIDLYLRRAVSYNVAESKTALAPPNIVGILILILRHDKCSETLKFSTITTILYMHSCKCITLSLALDPSPHRRRTTALMCVQYSVSTWEHGKYVGTWRCRLRRRELCVSISELACKERARYARCVHACTHTARVARLFLPARGLERIQCSKY